MQIADVDILSSQNSTRNCSFIDTIGSIKDFPSFLMGNTVQLQAQAVFHTAPCSASHGKVKGEVTTCIKVTRKDHLNAYNSYNSHL